ncbi:ATPase [Candidatus Endobugula sertula]|uniref:Cell division protein ZapE n=1 Tax=Candidatus Endobugula sertula TaxID=62101 RepID=A0A1D2QQK1_9GAMM|nr:ATPase [Candidatus Endobugula sertula]
MNLTPTERYQKDLRKAGFIPDEAQKMAVVKLQEIYDQMVAFQQVDSSIISTVKSYLFPKSSVPIKGLYLWGGVGRGKTYLMDNFYESLPFKCKMRSHFHRFMKRVHEELKNLHHKKNPLDIVADRIAKDTRVICFDEFFVSDIADAMILATLLDGLFRRGITLVATSNIVPDGLYQDGLQRARFLPAIALLNEHTEVVNVDGGIDYRLRSLEQAELYHYPLGQAADESLYESFFSLVPDKEEISEQRQVEIEGRYLSSRYHAEDVVWFDFDVLCDGPRSQNDYIEIAKEYHAVLVSGLRELTEQKEDQARRFINLVDEFYDRGVKLIISADKPVHEIYSGHRLSFEFERTVSRLLEMQSYEYLARPHKP